MDVVRALQYVRRLRLGIDASGQPSRPPIAVAAVNMSFGGLPQLRGQCNYAANGGDDSALRTALQDLSTAGVAVVAATGNWGPASKQSVSPPACYPQVIDVSAVAKNGADAEYSTSDSQTDLAAPGGTGGSTPPANCALLGQIEAVCSAGIGNQFQGRSGTSMAAPHVSGAFAVLRSKFPNATVEQIRQLLRATGTPTQVNVSATSSYLLPRINLARAIQQATAPVSPAISQASCSSALVSWSATPNMLPNTFEVQTSLNASFSPPLSNNVVPGTQTQISTPTSTSATVFARVRSCLSGSPGVCSDWSAPVQAFVGCPPPPSVVTADPPDCAGNVGGASWGVVSGATHFQVEERGPPFSFSGVATSADLQSPRFDKTLIPPDPAGTDVRIRVRSCNGSACGGWTPTSVLLLWGGDQCG